MTNHRVLSVNLQEVSARYLDATISSNPHAIGESLADIPPLISDVHALRLTLAIARLARANMIAAAYATLKAATDSEHDPFWYLRDELAAQHRLDASEREVRP